MPSKPSAKNIVKPVPGRPALKAIPPAAPARKPANVQPTSATMPTMDKLTTPSEAAETYGVSCETIRRYVRHGKLKAFQIPGHRGTYYIVRDELTTFMAPSQYRPTDSLAD